MPLRDHFHPPLSNKRSSDALHGGWPMVIVMDLNNRLPPSYLAEPQIHLGANFEIDGMEKGSWDGKGGMEKGGWKRGHKPFKTAIRLEWLMTPFSDSPFSD